MQTISFGSKATLAQNAAKAGTKAVQQKLAPNAAAIAKKAPVHKAPGGVGLKLDKKG